MALITLDRPEARNAVSPRVAAELEAAVDQLEGDDSLRVGVLTAVNAGDPPVFCAGADLKSIRGGRADDLQTERGGFAGFVYRARTKPIVANGPLAVQASLAVAKSSLATAEALDRMLATADLAEGLAAFSERRAPRWTGT